MSVQRLAILGATGSIGDSALDVVARHPDRFEVFALCAKDRWREMAELCRRVRPRVAVMHDATAARLLDDALAGSGTRVEHGSDAIDAVASSADVDTVLAAIVGAAGFTSTLAAARAGKRILLANKEALVMGGKLFMDAIDAGGATLLPIDSEHNAIFQCLGTQRDAHAGGVRRIVLTASGGPFRTRAPATLDNVTPDEACAHPNWTMGRKISVDSATMMNKGLEVIEAHWLFGLATDCIDVVIHPQSVVHSLVEYADGSMLAQLGAADMRIPIAHALAHPARIDSGAPSLDLASLGALTFEAADPARFPLLGLAYAALDCGGSAPLALSAANEVAVAAFLQGRARYPHIARTCEAVLARGDWRGVSSADDAIAADRAARACAREALGLPRDAGARSLAA